MLHSTKSTNFRSYIIFPCWQNVFAGHMKWLCGLDLAHGL